MAQAEDLGDYYRVPADVRDLNYSSFFSTGRAEVSEAADYNSHNTELLDVKRMMELLMKLQCVQDAMNGQGGVGMTTSSDHRRTWVPGPQSGGSLV